MSANARKCLSQKTACRKPNTRKDWGWLDRDITANHIDYGSARRPPCIAFNKLVAYAEQSLPELDFGPPNVGSGVYRACHDVLLFFFHLLTSFSLDS